jgi:hypothetical protein
MQVSHNRGERAFLKASNFEPGRPPDIARRPFHGNQIGGTCSQAASRRKKPIPKSLINSDKHLERQVSHAQS